MDQIKTGKFIRELRLRRGLTQSALAELLHVSDKAVSKWERGCGAPDVSSLAQLAEALQVDTAALLAGELDKNPVGNGDLNKTKFYVCPDCGAILTSTTPTDIRCCGRKLSPLVPQVAEGGERLTVSAVEYEWYITSAHEMSKAHYISFAAFISGDTVIMKKFYPEWGLETRIPILAHGTLLWYCTRHGAYYMEV